MADDDGNQLGESEPAPSEPEHHCVHCDEIAELTGHVAKLTAQIAVTADATEHAALETLGDILEIPEEIAS